MKYEDYCQMMNVKFQEDVLFACRFLDSRGMKFMVNYGWENAISLASEIVCNELYVGD